MSQPTGYLATPGGALSLPETVVLTLASAAVTVGLAMGTDWLIDRLWLVAPPGTVIALAMGALYVGAALVSFTLMRPARPSRGVGSCSTPKARVPATLLPDAAARVVPVTRAAAQAPDPTSSRGRVGRWGSAAHRAGRIPAVS
ncbi:MAG TPA: hypothetical protein VFM54_20035 [Micromonosporaceae bacterium]|nr:hypothetical protein [Micromonosporaceae bacterium]